MDAEYLHLGRYWMGNLILNSTDKKPVYLTVTLIYSYEYIILGIFYTSHDSIVL